MSRIIQNLLLAATLVLLGCFQASANHIMGSEISCTYYGGTDYFVTVNTFRDCNSIPISPADILAFDKNKTITVSAASSGGNDITPVCTKSSCTRCSNSKCSFGFGMQKYTFTAVIDVSQLSDCNITFSCVENSYASTTNISNGSGNDTYVECNLNRCKSEHNSPVFEFDPRPLLCKGQIVDELVSAAPGDPNDSIVYHLITPLQDHSTQLVYKYPFSYLGPLSFNGVFNDKVPNGFHYDAKTGELYFVPTKVETSFMSWQADEYLKDSTGKYYLASTIMRTMEMTVMNCSNTDAPVITAPADTIYTCTDIPVIVRAKTGSANINDTIKLSLDNPTSGIVNITNSTQPVGTFAWIPDHSDAQKKPYILTFSAKDNKCPLYGFSQKRFYIFVKDSFPITGIKLRDSGCGKYHAGLSAPINKYFKVSYSWQLDNAQISTIPEFSFRSTQAGKHILSLTITNLGVGCSKTFYDTIYYDTSYQKLFNSVVGICKGDVVQLNAAQGKSLTWTPTNGLSNSNIYNPVAKPDTSTLYTITGTDGNNCKYTDQMKITVGDYKLARSKDLSICAGQTGKLFVDQVPGSTITWSTKNKSNFVPFAYGDTIIVKPNQATEYYVSINLNGCIKTDSIHVTVHPTFYELPDENVCYNDSIVLNNDGGKNYLWYNRYHPAIIVSTDSFYIIHQATNLVGYPMESIKTNNKTGCRDTTFINVLVLKFNPAISKTVANICRKDSALITATGGNKYVWAYNKAIISNKDHVYLKADTTSIFSVTITDTLTGCHRTFNITVNVNLKSVRYPDQSICNGSSISLNARDTGNLAYLWSPSKGLSSSNIKRPVASPTSTTKYMVQVVDLNTTCSHIDTVLVAVDNDCVWPGDANHDRTANYLDVLNIGVGYGNKGPSRSNPSNVWQPNPVALWNKSTSTGVNYKHLDCNGDGIIDSKDTVAVSLNYNKTHPKWTRGSGNPNDPPVYFKFDKDTFYAGDTAVAYLLAGTNSKPVKNAYGIGYQATYLASPAISNGISLNPFCDYFCAGQSMNYIRPYYSSNTVEATIVKTDQIGTLKSTGKFGALKFILHDTLTYPYTKPEWIYARLQSITTIDSTGKELSVYGIDDSAIVLKKRAPKPNGIAPQGSLDQNFKIYPNPANNEVIVESSMELNQIKILNNLGQVIMDIPNTKKTKNFIDISTIPGGIYFMEIRSENNLSTQKFVIDR